MTPRPRSVLLPLAVPLAALALAGASGVSLGAPTTEPSDVYDSFVVDGGCTVCAVAFVGPELEAAVGGGANTVDTAFGLRDFGGAAGWSGRVHVRDVIRLAPGQLLKRNLSVFQIRDVADRLVYEVFVAYTDLTLRLYSPPGGLRSTSLTVNTKVKISNDGATVRRVEVAAEANGSILVRVDGLDKYSLFNLRNATTGPQRYLRAGIDHYDGNSANDPVRGYHSGVAVSQAGWLGEFSSDGTPPAPPTGFDAALSAEEVALSWTDPTDPDLAHVRVVRKAGAEPLDPDDGVVVCNCTGGQAVDSAPPPGATHHYAAYAFDVAGNASDPARDSVEAPPDTTSPGAVTGFSASLVGPTVSLEWIDPTDADLAHVRVIRRIDSEPQDPDDGVLVCDCTGGQAADSRPPAGQTYYYAAYAVDGSGNLSTAERASAEAPPDWVPPDPPTAFEAVLAGAVVSLSWDDPADPELAHVRVVRKAGSEPQGPDDGVLVCDCTGGEAADSRPPAGETYHYAAYAVDFAGNDSEAARVAVTAPAQSGSDVYDSFVVDASCSACSLTFVGTELGATIGGGADSVDTAYGLRDFAGPGGWAGLVYVRDVVRLAAGQTLGASLSVFQVRDDVDNLVYELYVSKVDYTIRLYSPPRGLRGNAISVSTGVPVPTDGVSARRVEVAAQANGSLTIRIDDVDRVTLTGLVGATTLAQRSLRAGIDHYDTQSVGQAVRAYHSRVGATQSGWLGESGDPPVPPPQNTAPPTISGVAEELRTLDAATGTWTPATALAYAYQWLRCDEAGGNCTELSGSTGSRLTLIAGWAGSTVRVTVTATNSSGSRSATSDPSAEIAAATTSVPALSFTRRDVDGDGGQPTDSSGVGDIDGDSRPDVVVAGWNDLAWYRNPDWSRNVIASSRHGTGAVTFVRDLDGDARADVIAGDYAAAATVWFANKETGWERHVFNPEAYCHDVAFADLDGDGREDIACTDKWSRQLVWLAAPEDPTQPWALRVIDSRYLMGIAVGDVDRDGRLDVVSGRAWYRNTGESPWPRHPYTTLSHPTQARFDDFAELLLVDINGDGRLDVFASLFAETLDGVVYAFLAPEDPLTGQWQAVEVDAGPLFGVHTIGAGSFDGSSRLQVLVGEANVGGWGFGVNPDPQLYVYRLLGPGEDFASWQRTTIDTVATHYGVVADMNADGLPDLVGHADNTELLSPPTNGPVMWWENRTAG